MRPSSMLNPRSSSTSLDWNMFQLGSYITAKVDAEATQRDSCLLFSIERQGTCVFCSTQLKSWSHAVRLSDVHVQSEFQVKISDSDLRSAKLSEQQTWHAWGSGGKVQDKEQQLRALL